MKNCESEVIDRVVVEDRMIVTVMKVKMRELRLSLRQSE
jgi:hypothetical protein